MFRNFSKKSGRRVILRLWVKTASSATVNACLFYWTCVKYGSSVKCLLSVCSVISLFSCLAVNNCIEILLDFSAFFHVTRSFLYQSDCRTFQTSILKKQAILSLNLDIIQWLDILGTRELIKYFYLVLARLTQFFLDQSDSKILETPITQEKF